jgi:hypothetical protein
LLGVTDAGEWEEWLLYSLDGVRRQSHDSVERIRRIETLTSGWHEKLARAPLRVMDRVIELLTENLFCTVNSSRAATRWRYHRAAIGGSPRDRGHPPGGLGGKAHRVYCARGLLRILEDPPE